MLSISKKNTFIYFGVVRILMYSDIRFIRIVSRLSISIFLLNWLIMNIFFVFCFCSFDFVSFSDEGCEKNV